MDYMSTLIGVNEFPLYYVVQENDNPHAKWQSPNFIDKKILCAPLKGD